MESKKLSDEIKKVYDGFLPDNGIEKLTLDGIIERSNEADILSSSPVMKEVKMKKSLKPAICVAALTAMLFSFGGLAVANGWFGIDEFVGEQETETYTVYMDTEDGENIAVGTETRVRQALYTCGPLGSPEVNACKEWSRYWSDFIRFSDLPDGNPYGFKSIFYDAYTEEAVKKLDEICEKYSLKYITEETDTVSPEDLYAKLGTEKIFNIDFDLWYAYCMTGGSFHAEPSYKSSGRSISVDIDFCKSGYMYGLRGNRNIHDISEFDQWDYVTEDGYHVYVMDRDTDDADAVTIALIKIDGGYFYVRLDSSGVKIDERLGEVDDFRCMTHEETMDFISKINLSALGGVPDDGTIEPATADVPANVNEIMAGIVDPDAETFATIATETSETETDTETTSGAIDPA